MNVNNTRIAGQSRMEEAPGTRPTSPSEVLAVLRSTLEQPPAILIDGLWKTGLQPEPQGAVS